MKIEITDIERIKHKAEQTFNARHAPRTAHQYQPQNCHAEHDPDIAIGNLRTDIKGTRAGHDTKYQEDIGNIAADNIADCEACMPAQ